ncbi:MAG: MarR family transcriptional regulator [Alphaproteobacteria bacterium]|nr:MarR family transcriptional regulator [Alphaproteobacteria bacterium]
MVAKPSESTVRAWARLVRVETALMAAVEDALKAADLPPLAWYDALLELSRAPAGSLRPRELQREMLLAQYNASRLIDRLELAGLVERRPCPEDGRGQIVRITRSGRTLAKRMWPVYAAAIQRLVGERLSDAEADRLFALLGKLRTSD